MRGDDGMPQRFGSSQAARPLAALGIRQRNRVAVRTASTSYVAGGEPDSWSTRSRADGGLDCSTPAAQVCATAAAVSELRQRAHGHVVDATAWRCRRTDASSTRPTRAAANRQVVQARLGGPACCGDVDRSRCRPARLAPLPFPCSDRRWRPLLHHRHPADARTLGAIDHAAATVIYAAPAGPERVVDHRGPGDIHGDVRTRRRLGHGQRRRRRVRWRRGGGTSARRDRRRPGRVHRRPGLQRRQRRDPAGPTEIKGNRIDENCDGVAEPFPTLTAGVAHTWT